MTLRITTEHRGKVKAKAVDVIFGCPVAEAIEDKVANHRMIAIKGIAATAEVEVGAVWRE